MRARFFPVGSLVSREQWSSRPKTISGSPLAIPNFLAAPESRQPQSTLPHPHHHPVLLVVSVESERALFPLMCVGIRIRLQELKDQLDVSLFFVLFSALRLDSTSPL